jgi:hypothetical protein
MTINYMLNSDQLISFLPTVGIGSTIAGQVITGIEKKALMDPTTSGYMTLVIVHMGSNPLPSVLQPLPVTTAIPLLSSPPGLL